MNMNVNATTKAALINSGNWTWGHMLTMWREVLSAHQLPFILCSTEDSSLTQLWGLEQIQTRREIAMGLSPNGNTRKSLTAVLLFELPCYGRQDLRKSAHFPLFPSIVPKFSRTVTFHVCPRKKNCMWNTFQPEKFTLAHTLPHSLFWTKCHVHCHQVQ